MSHGFYVTGTDTAVGKTHVSVAMLHALRARGGNAVGMKPVASGCQLTSEGWRNEDALALQLASNPVPAYAEVNPFALPAATAPQIAAAQAGVRVSLPPILTAFAQLSGSAESIVVEGVGGWLAPLADGLEQSELASALRLPVILVVGMKLGCLSHARLTERAIVGDGLQIAGWIGNFAQPGVQFPDDYAQLLRRALASPCLGLFANSPDRTAASFSAQLRLPEFA